jgi:hypothetical protein
MRKSKSRSQAKSSLLVATSVTAVAAVTTVAAVTAAVTTTATTVAAASTTTETAAVTAGRAGVGDVDSDATTVKLLLVEAVDSSGSLLLAGKGNETEATGTAGLTVLHDDRVGDLTELAEGRTESLIRGVPGQVSNVKLRHDCACCCKCSRERSKRSESS